MPAMITRHFLKLINILFFYFLYSSNNKLRFSVMPDNMIDIESIRLVTNLQWRWAIAPSGGSAEPLFRFVEIETISIQQYTGPIPFDKDDKKTGQKSLLTAVFHRWG